MKSSRKYFDNQTPADSLGAWLVAFMAKPYKPADIRLASGICKLDSRVYAETVESWVIRLQ